MEEHLNKSQTNSGPRADGKPCTGLFKRSDTWVGWTWISLFYSQPNFAWVNGNLAEMAGELGKKVERTDQSQPNTCI